MHICSSSSIYVLLAAQWCNPTHLCTNVVPWDFAEKHCTEQKRYLVWFRYGYVHACGYVCVFVCLMHKSCDTWPQTGGRQSLRWVGLKTSDAWLRGPGSSSRRLLLLCVYVCVYMCMRVWFGGPEGLSGAILAGVSGKSPWSDKSSSVPCSISVCCLGCNILLLLRV